MLAAILCSSLVMTSCSNDDNAATAESAEMAKALEGEWISDHQPEYHRLAEQPHGACGHHLPGLCRYGQESRLLVDETIQYRRHEAGGCRDQTELKVVAGSPFSGSRLPEATDAKKAELQQPRLPNNPKLFTLLANKPNV